MDDGALLHRYAQLRDEGAFKELVARHIDFVYAAALRQVGGDRQFAQDVAQLVFCDLARKAARLADHPVLKGWLFTSARFAAAKLVRRERLRQRLETSAHVMEENLKEDPAVAWEEIRPVLDDALAELKRGEREAVLLRFFESEGYAVIGRKLSLSEDAARMRVERALERMRQRLGRRGIRSTPAMLAGILTTQAGTAAPVGLEHAIANVVLAHVAGAGSTAGLIHFMGLKTNLSIAGFLGLAGLLSLPMAGVAVYEARAARHAEIATTSAQREQLEQINRLKAVQQEAGSSAARTAEIRKALNEAQAALTESLRASAQSGGSKSRDPRTDGALFLASYPQARRLLIEASRDRTFPGLVEIYRRAGLAPAKIEELNRRMWEGRVDTLTLSPKGMGSSSAGFLPDEEMQQLLGPTGFAEYKGFIRTMGVYQVATQIAATIAYNAPPLSETQIGELAQAIAKVEPSGQLAPGSPEWEIAVEPLRRSMTAEQWQIAEGAFANAVFPRVLAWAQRNTGKTAAPSGNSGSQTP